jgi:transposase-like protein
VFTEIKEQIIDMALKGSGILDTARVLGTSTDTVQSELKKRVVPEPCEPLCARLVEPG